MSVIDGNNPTAPGHAPSSASVSLSEEGSTKCAVVALSSCTKMSNPSGMVVPVSAEMGSSVYPRLQNPGAPRLWGYLVLPEIPTCDHLQLDLRQLR